MEEQQKIIDIIEPKEDFLIKHLNLIDISTFNSAKDDIKKIIDIIEPIEKLMTSLNKISNTIDKILNKINLSETDEKNIFSEIRTGKKNVNASIKNGKYPFYTCGSKILRTNTKNFSGKYILLSGNGEIYTWWIDGDFDLYQRVYALKEKNNFFTTFYSVNKGIEKLRKRSNGAVIKFIKLNDIKSIKMYDSKLENELSIFYKLQSISKTKLEFLEKLKNKVIKLLIK
ncbi:MAG: hypothetical protein NC236_01105 [Mycoplasma sp.]|nr:hypothetical protein [Mycoplasma sp.]